MSVCECKEEEEEEGEEEEDMTKKRSREREPEGNSRKFHLVKSIVRELNAQCMKPTSVFTDRTDVEVLVTLQKRQEVLAMGLAALGRSLAVVEGRRCHNAQLHALYAAHIALVELERTLAQEVALLVRRGDGDGRTSSALSSSARQRQFILRRAGDALRNAVKGRVSGVLHAAHPSAALQRLCVYIEGCMAHATNGEENGLVICVNALQEAESKIQDARDLKKIPKRLGSSILNVVHRERVLIEAGTWVTNTRAASSRDYQTRGEKMWRDMKDALDDAAEEWLLLPPALLACAGTIAAPKPPQVLIKELERLGTANGDPLAALRWAQLRLLVENPAEVARLFKNLFLQHGTKNRRRGDGSRGTTNTVLGGRDAVFTMIAVMLDAYTRAAARQSPATTSKRSLHAAAVIDDDDDSHRDADGDNNHPTKEDTKELVGDILSYLRKDPGSEYGMRKLVRMAMRNACPIPALIGALVSQLEISQSELCWTTLSALCTHCRCAHRVVGVSREAPTADAGVCFGSCDIGRGLSEHVVPRDWLRYFFGTSKGPLYFVSRQYLRRAPDDPRRLTYERVLWAKANVAAHLFGHTCSFPKDVISVLSTDNNSESQNSLQAGEVLQSLEHHGCPCYTCSVSRIETWNQVHGL